MLLRVSTRLERRFRQISMTATLHFRRGVEHPLFFCLDEKEAIGYVKRPLS